MPDIKRETRKKILIGIGIAIVAIAIPFILSGEFPHHVLTMMCIWAILGMGWNFIGGYAGQVSNGHALFYGIGAYACAVGMWIFKLSPWITMWIGMAISALIALIVGKALLRFHGHVFAIASMAIAECGRIIFLNWNAIGGATGVYFYNPNMSPWLAMQFKNSYYYYFLYLAFALVVLAITKKLDKTRFCYYLRTIKGNEAAAESVGIDTAKYKMLAYILSAVIVSLAGSLYAQFILYIDPSILMTLNISMMIVLIAVMGGIGTVWGPIIGSVVLTFISEYTRVKFGSKLSGIDMIIYGVLVIVIVLFLPEGLISLPSKWRKPARKAKEAAL